MIPLPSVQGLDEILSEQEAVARAGHSLDRSPDRSQFTVARPPSPGKSRSVHIGPAGRDLTLRCTQESRELVDRLVQMESTYEDPSNRTLLILGGSEILERELRLRVGDPSRRLGRELLDTAADRLAPKQLEALERWLEGKVPSTLPVIELVMFALCSGLEQKNERVEALIERKFEKEFSEILKNGGPVECLGRIRQRYRNPAAHGRGKFLSREYGAFCRLVIGSRSFGTWYQEGPENPRPAPNHALLHHELSHLRTDVSDSRLRSESAAMSPGQRMLFNLKTPPESQLGVTCLVGDAANEPVSMLRIEDQMRIGVQVNQDCHLCLIFFPLERPAALMFPNRLMSESWIESKSGLALPDDLPSPLVMTAEGPPGRERILAIASKVPLEVPGISRDSSELFVDVGQAALVRLGACIADLPRSAWAVAHAELTIVK